MTGSDNSQVAAQRLDIKPGESAFTAAVTGSGGMQSGDYAVRVRLRSPMEGELALIDTGPHLGEIAAIAW